MSDRLLEFYNDLECGHIFNSYIFYPKHIWRRHLHIKMNDVCDKKCAFCIERNNSCYEDNSERYYIRLKRIIKELVEKKVIKTVSITGGEPLLNIDKVARILEILENYKFDFVNINTNGQRLTEALPIIQSYKVDSINISRHHYNDEINNRLFGAETILNLPVLSNTVQTKLRLQCVCVNNGINSKKEIERYIDKYSKGQIYDFNFRQLIKPEKYGQGFINWENNNISLKPIYKEFLQDDLYNMSFIHNDEYEYYVEFVSKIKPRQKFLLCYTDMNKIYDIEQIEPSNIFREFIYFPDGTISGSWSKERKKINI